MKLDTLHRWIWTLIYGGLLIVGLGLSVQCSDAFVGWILVVAGGVAAAVGIGLIAVRARMKDPP